MMDNQFIAKNIIQNLIEVISIATSFSTHDEAGTKDLQGSLRYFSGCEFPFFNGVFNNYQNQPAILRDHLSTVIDFFAAKKMPFIWWWTQQAELPIEMKQELDDKGFQFLGEFSGIAIKLDQVEMDYTFNRDDIKITQVNNDNEYKKFIDILCKVFHLSDSIKNDFEKMYQSYGTDGKFNHYLCFYQNEAVATLSSYINKQIVGFYNAATLPKAQKMGLCTSLVKHIIKDAINAGCEHGVAQLMLPAMAKGLTDKMGFKNYCRLLPFLKNP